jgi:hypothetical protein
MRIPAVNLIISRRVVLLALVILVLLIQVGPGMRPSEGGETVFSPESPTAELDEWLEQPGVTVVERVTLPRVQRVRLSNGVECLSIFEGAEIVDTGCTR